jgi:glycerophosphoryl diester phosphodiesterase
MVRLPSRSNARSQHGAATTAAPRRRRGPVTPTSTRIARLAFCACLMLLACAAHAEPPERLVIAHRGASGYLPEHTLAAYAFAHAQGADYLEPDIVVTRDGHAVALHDLYLDAVTDVRTVFPGRARDDGLHYAIDFSLDELRRLNVNERIDLDSGEPRYPARFPPQSGRFGVVTLAELIELTQGLNRSTGRDVGIYPELKAPAFHAAHGHDIAAIVLGIVERHGYRSVADRCLIQSFEPEALIRLRNDLKTELRLVQLLGENDWAMNDIDYDAMYTAAGLAQIATYADAIGVPIERVIAGRNADGRPIDTGLAARAGAQGLVVHAYTLRVDAPLAGFTAAELAAALEHAGVHGVFTDHVDALRPPARE